MQRTILVVGRLVFLSVFGVISVLFLLWETVTFVKYQPGHKSTYSVVYDMGSNEGLAVSASNEEDTNVVRNGEFEVADARPLIVRRYLEKYKSPLADYAELICELSDTYGFEYYWIPAIAQQESNLCKKIPEGSFNCWGYGIHSKGTLRFESYDLALRSYAEYLNRVYFEKGLNTAELIMKKYCPYSDGSWARGVNQFIRQMETGEY
ncbi:MAG: hypothetical protein WC841_02410 [Candidatus Shapirobacteria bacterium]|jgi:hypothetical protein